MSKNTDQYNILNTDLVEEYNVQLFFGEKSKIIRVDQISHEIFKKIKEAAEGNTWFVREIDYKSDKTRSASLPEDAKRAFEKNIAYQTLMDSGVTNGLTEVLIECASSSILELLYRKIAYEESIHAESYSYGLYEVFGDTATSIINQVSSDEVVKNRMNVESSLFADLSRIMNNESTEDEKKRALIKILLALYCLEGIKFPFSFLVTFIVNDKYNNSIPGFTRTIQLIAHDELTVHVPTTKNVFNVLMKDPQQGFADLFDKSKENNFYQMLDEIIKITVDSEIEWAKYLFEGRQVEGINVESSIYFIKWRANYMYRSLGIIDNPYKEYVDNSITEFFDTYRDINKQNAAAQETDAISYQKNTIVQDWDDLDKKTL